MSPIVIKLVLAGIAATTTGLKAVGSGGKQMGADVADGASKASKGLDQLQAEAAQTGKGFEGLAEKGQKAGAVLASAWSPAISAAKAYEAQQRKLAQQKLPVNAGAASAWNPYISAVKKAEAELKKAQAEQAKLAAQKLPTFPGAASVWNPYISAVKRAEAEQAKLAAQKMPTYPGAASVWNPYISAVKKAEAEQAKLAAMKMPVHAGAASTWNPYISAVKRAEAEQAKLLAEARQLPNALRGVASASASIMNSVRSGGSLRGGGALRTQMGHLNAGLQRDDYSNITMAANDVRNVGLGVGAVGTGGMLLLGKMVKDAGSMEKTRAGFKSMLGSDQEADRMINELSEFDARSPFSFQQTVSSAQFLKNMGIERENLIPTMEGLGNAVARSGGGSDEFDRAAYALGQVKAFKKFRAAEGMQFVQAGIPVYEILQKQLGYSDAKMTRIRQGDEELSADIALPALQKGLTSGSYAGAMEGAMNTLPGQIETLGGSLFQLSSIMGSTLLPVIKPIVSITTSLVNGFRALPGPIQAVITYGLAFGSTVLVLGGGLLVVAGMAAGAMVNILSLSGSLTTLSLTSGGASASIIAGLVPALIGMATVLGLAAVSIAGFSIAVGGSAAASSQSAYELQQHFGALGTFWARAADTLTAIWNHPLLKGIRTALNPGGSLIGHAMGLDADTSKGDADERKSYEMDVKKWRRRGQRIKSFEEWSGGNPNSEEWTAPTTPAPAVPATPVWPQPGAASTGYAFPMAPGLPALPRNAMPPILPSAAGVASGATAAPALGSSAYGGTVDTDDIESLEDAIHGEETTRSERKVLKERLRLARRSSKHQKEMEREAAKEERDQERKEKREKREADKASKAALRLSDRRAGLDAKIEEAELNADTAAQVAQLKASGAPKSAIARVKANAELKRGAIRARGEGSDTLGSSMRMKLAQIKSRGLMEIGDVEGEGESSGGRGSRQNQQRLNSLLALTRRGGSLFDTSKKATSDGEGGSGGSGGGGVDRRTFTAQIGSNSYSGTKHEWDIRFQPIKVADPYGRDSEML